MKRTVTSNVDFLSNLPDIAIENIFRCLPLRDIVRTSTLSRDWRYKWLTCPEIVLDYRLDKPPIYIMERLQGQLLKFFLRLPESQTYPDINQLIHMLPNNSVQDLTLHMCTTPRHKLTPHLFTFQNLRNLKLFNCVFDTPSGFKGFRKLVSVELHGCSLVPETFWKFVASCPAVESLSLNNCTSFDCLEITGPKLKSFDFRGVFNSISFRNCPVLSNVKLSFSLKVSNGRRFSFDLVKSLSCLPSLEDLKLQADALEDLIEYGAPNKLPTALKTLKNLDIFILKKPKETSSTISFIRSCPNLQTLVITSFRYENEGYLVGDMRWPPKRMVHHRTVKIQLFSGIESLMELVKYLLASATSLKEIYTRPLGFIIQHELDILNKLKQYPHASLRVEATSLDGKRVKKLF